MSIYSNICFYGGGAWGQALAMTLSSLNNNSTILEIGPGTGNLTEKLISKRPQKMILVEKDKNLCQNLKNKFNDKVEVINKDFLDLKINYKKCH